jgi:hypothetical protein
MVSQRHSSPRSIKWPDRGLHGSSDSIPRRSQVVHANLRSQNDLGSGILQSSSLKGFEHGAEKSGPQIPRGSCKA